MIEVEKVEGLPGGGIFLTDFIVFGLFAIEKSIDYYQH